jgi:hypothetical protein
VRSKYSDEINNLVKSITVGFQKHVRPWWDEIEKHCVWRHGASAIYIFGKDTRKIGRET